MAQYCTCSSKKKYELRFFQDLNNFTDVEKYF